MNLASEFARVASTRPGQTAVYWDEKEISYTTLLNQSRWLSHRLQTVHGIKAGDRVAIWVRNCPDFPALLFAVWQAGGVVVMINHFLKPDEVAFILHDSGARAVISEAGLAEAHEKLKDVIPASALFLRESLPTPDAVVTPEGFTAIDRLESDLAALLYTSGTTGHPKGAMLTHGNFLHNVRSCLQCLEVTDKDRLVVVLPQFHSFMFTVGTLVPMLGGAAILLLKSLHPMKHVLEEIISHKGSILPAVPQFWRAMAQMGPPPGWPLRLCISGGAPLPVEVLQEFNRKFPNELVEGYGPTESSPVATVNPIHGFKKPGSVGVPIPDVELSIRDEDGKELPLGQTGEICIRGGNVMQGYWQQPEETAKTIRDNWLYTGDVGHRDVDNYFYITDRKKDMLLVNGINVYPREIEEVIHQMPGIKETAVIGRPDHRRGEMPVAYVVPVDGTTLDEKTIVHFIRERLADYKVPRHVIFLPALPRNATGKILKTKLRELSMVPTAG